MTESPKHVYDVLNKLIKDNDAVLRENTILFGVMWLLAIVTLLIHLLVLPDIAREQWAWKVVLGVQVIGLTIFSLRSIRIHSFGQGLRQVRTVRFETKDAQDD